MIGDLLKNRKGEVQTDKYGKNLTIGQSVIVMDVTHSKGSRGTVSTGVVVAFDRYPIVVQDQKFMVSDRDVDRYIKFYEDKADKTVPKWDSDYQERENRGLERWPSTVPSHHMIGCTEKVRRGWRDGTLFEE